MMEYVGSSLNEWFPDFFKQWPEGIVENTTPERNFRIDCTKLASLFEQLSEPLKSIQYSSIRFDPWEVAELGRNEVRNTSVLSWILNPHESHGFGRKPLQGLLQALRESGRSDFPEDFIHYCKVQVETTPCGNNINRVDIEINADNFYLLIEVKIDAREQDSQISRYCFDAKNRAISRPWGVIFLTPHGNKPLTCGNDFSHKDVPCLSWRYLADTIDQHLRSEHKGSVTIPTHSDSNKAAAHAVYCFLNRARQF